MFCRMLARQAVYRVTYTKNKRYRNKYNRQKKVLKIEENGKNKIQRNVQHNESIPHLTASTAMPHPLGYRPAHRYLQHKFHLTSVQTYTETPLIFCVSGIVGARLAILGRPVYP